MSAAMIVPAATSSAEDTGGGVAGGRHELVRDADADD
jgi:hypothetical protein